MNDILIALTVFGVLLGSALFGMLLGKILPTQHLTPETRDVVRVVMAMLATLSAVVLGLLTGSAIASLGEKEGELRNAGVQFILLDRTLASYGPETAATRERLKQLLEERIGRIWPEEGRTVALAALGEGPGIDLIQQATFDLTPRTEEQVWLKSTALQLTQALSQSRWTTLEQIGSRFPWPFFVVVVFWLGVIFASFGLFAPRNGSVVAALFVAALGLSGAVFMVLEMDQPYRGIVKIPSTPLRIALEQLGG